MEWRHQPSGHATSKCRLLSLSVGNSNGAISGLSLWTMYAAILLLLLAHSSTLASGQPTEYIETHPQTTRHYCNYSNPDRTNLACHCPRPKCGCYYEKSRDNGIIPFGISCISLKTVPVGIYQNALFINFSYNFLTSLDNGGLQESNLSFPEMFDASFNRITEIKDNTLAPLNTVFKLLLGHNKIASISPVALRNFSRVTEIDLSSNTLTSLSSGLFDGCPKLVTLSLNDNQLVSLPVGLFKKTTMLANFSLDENQLTSIPAGAFDFLPRLTHLFLRHNKLQELPSHLFVNNVNLIELDLDFNLLTSVPYHAFGPNSKLAHWSLGFNNISSLTAKDFSNTHRLQTLSLSGNSLQGKTGTVPRYLFANLVSLRKLYLSSTDISYTPNEFFERLCNLEHLDLSENHLYTNPPAAFLWQTCLGTEQKLTHLDISGSKFVELPEIGPTCNLVDLEASWSALEKFVWTSQSFSFCKLCNKIESIDFTSSSLSVIANLQNCTQLSTLYLGNAKFTTETFDGVVTNHTNLDGIILKNNRLTTISSKTFGYMERLQTLDLSGNRQLKQIDSDAFIGLGALTELYLGDTAITSLPITEANGFLRVLVLYGTKSLINFPPVSLLPKLTTARMEYAFHCCLFVLAELKAAKSAVTTIPPTQSTAEYVGPTGNVTKYHGTRTGHVDEFTEEEQRKYEEIWGNGTKTEPILITIEHPHGPNQKLDCSPRPGPFTPCESLFSAMWLRIAAWTVAVLALCGNITVIFVIVFGKAKLDNTRFLVLNLAVADLFLGIYVLVLCVVDAVTQGKFGEIALKWQESEGPKVAGFLAVVSTEMSFYTLMLITLERYVTITHSIDVRYSFTRKRLKVMVVLGWLFALVLAVLPVPPLLSSYNTSVLALPFKLTEVYDQAYVGFLLVFNGVSIAVISFCYLKIFWEVRHSPAFCKNDYQIARRMALLVIVDLACWLPLAIFGLAATFAGTPLVGLSAAKVLVVFVFPLNSCANPFLYAIVTSNFQRDLIIILKSFPEKVGDLSRRRSKTPQPTDSQRSFLQAVALYMAQQARKNMDHGSSSGVSYNNSAGLPSNSHGNSSRPKGVRIPFDTRLANSSQMDASTSSEGNNSLMSPTGVCVPELCERRTTIVSCHASEVTDITECGHEASEMGDTQTPTPTSGDKHELEMSHRALPPPVTTNNALPDISEMSDPTSSSTSDHGQQQSAVKMGDLFRPKSGAAPPPRVVTGGLLMGALSSMVPMLVGSSSSKNQASANRAPAKIERDDSPQTRSTILDKADVESMEKEEIPDLVGSTKTDHSADFVSVRHNSLPATDKTPFCTGLIETSL